MRNTFLFLLLCCFSGGILHAQSVTPWLTSGDQSSLLAQQPTVEFGDQIAPAPATITLNADNTFQSIDGFGYTLTQGSAFVISQMNSSQRSQLLNELYGPNGMSMEIVRIGIGATDLGATLYTYNETVGDVNMDNFSLEGPDLTYLVPVLQEILAINPDIKVLASPWSAPKWMKTNNSYIGGELRPELYSAYALYFVKYLEAMDAQGIPIWAITPQNEPLNFTNDPSMGMNEFQQVDFINNHLGPQIANSPYSPKIIAYDHNCDRLDYPIYVLNNSDYVDGAAFHLYDPDSNIGGMSEVRNATGKNMYFTEQYTGSEGSFDGDFGWHMQNIVVGSLSNWSKTVFSWNLAADSQNGPFTPGGCSTCLPAVTVPNATSFSRNVAYYIIAQVSKFIRAGAVRVETSNNNSAISSVAFTNPDGTRVLLAYNGGAAGISVRVRDNGAAFDYTIPGRSAITFVWTPGPDNNTPFPSTEGVRFPFAGSPVVLPGIVEAENFDLGGQDLAYNDNDPGNIGEQYRDEGVDIENASEGGQNVGWTDAGEWLTYSVDVAQAGTYDLTLRVASADSTGQVSILFDGNDKTGVVDVSGTGDWQAWQDLVIADVDLDAGPQIMRINILSGGFNLNRVTVSESVEDEVVQSPFGGTPAVIPGIVEAENFDEGGQDVAYSDSDLTNNGGQYRNTAVDISNSGEGGQSVGWISNGEWLEYTVDVATAGDYDFTLRIASFGGSGQMNVAFDGTDATGNISIPNTGGWANWQDLIVNDIPLAAGTQVMRINITGGGFNLNRVTVSESVEDEVVQSPFGGTPAAIPGIVEAENFDEGGQDVAYSDSDLTNNGGQYRNTAVDISNSGEGGQSVGWISNGEWLEYTVDVATAGDYDFTLRIASPNGSGQMDIAFDGTNATGNISIPNTGGWSNWQDLVVSDVPLAAGIQVMRVNIISGSFNINRITVSASPPPPTGGGDLNLAGFYNIISRSSGKGLDVDGVSTSNNANIQQYDVNNGGGDNQRWEFDLQDDGYYTIKAKHSGLCLTQVSTSSRNVVQQNCNNFNRQKWLLIDVGDGFFTLRNKFSDEHLDVQDNSTSNGANIQVWSSTGNSNQQWRFEQIENSAIGRLAGTKVQSMIGGQAEQIGLFPNPFTERLTVNLPVKHDISDAALFDATGKQLLTISVEPDMLQIELELGQLPAGFYTIHFNSPTQPLTKRVIKD